MYIARRRESLNPSGCTLQNACSIIETDMMVDFAPFDEPGADTPTAVAAGGFGSGSGGGGGGSGAASATNRSRASSASVDSKMEDAPADTGAKLGGTTPVGLTPRELRLQYFQVTAAADVVVATAAYRVRVVLRFRLLR